MDRKEAIDILNDERIVIWTEPDEEEIARKQNEAIDMAIEALSECAKGGDEMFVEAFIFHLGSQVTPWDTTLFKN